MPKIPVDIFQGQSGDAEVDFNDDLPVNMFHVPAKISGVNGYLRSQWGLSNFAESQGIDQGGLWSSVFNSHFRVSNGELVEIDELGSVSVIGPIGYTGQCTFNQTERNIAITTDSGCWLYNSIDGLRQISDPDLGAVFDTVYINQRLIHTDGEFVIVSDPGQDEVYNALKYGTAEIDPDGIVGLETISNRLLAVGRDTIEWFADQPTTGDSFPYVRIESQLIEAGAIGTYAKVRMNDEGGFKSVYFIGGGKNDPLAIRQVGAGNAPKVSTPEIEKILLSYTSDELSTAVMENRTIEGNNFVIAHLPNETIMLDLETTKATGRFAWTIAKSKVGGVEQAARWINGVFDPRFNAFIYGDKISSVLGKLEKAINTEYGQPRSEWIYCATIPINYKSINSLTIKTLPGRNAPSTSPVIFLSTQENYGLIWSQEHLISRGGQGDYQHQIEVRNLGFYRQDVAIRLRMESAQPINVLSVTADINQ